MQVHICPKLKEKGIDCKPETVTKFVNCKPDSVSKVLQVEPVGIINPTSVRTIGTKCKCANGFHDVTTQVDYRLTAVIQKALYALMTVPVFYVLRYEVFCH